MIPILPNQALPNYINDANMFMQGSAFSSRCATLYLFTPKHLSDQFRRPHVYKFEQPFIWNIQNTIEHNKVSQRNINMSSFMVGNAEANTSVMPNMHGIPIQTNPLRIMWTFVLIVDNDKDPSIGMYLKVNQRAIYSGYCTDEPVSVGLNGMNPQPNPQCFFVVTHRTSTNVGNVISQTGTVPQMHVSSNADILPVDNIIMTSPTPEIYDITPRSINRNVVDNPNNGTVDVFAGNHSLLQRNAANQNGNPIIDAEFSSPKHHMHWVVNNLQKAILDVHPLVGNEQALLMQGSGTSMAETSFDSYMDAASPSNYNDPLNSNHPIAFPDILRRYPDLDIKDCRAPYETPWYTDTANQGESTPKNVAQAVLSYTVPFLLNEFQLCDVSFRYASYMTDGISNIKGMDQPDMVTSIIPMADEFRYQKYRMFIERMKILVFPILEQIDGPFDLMMTCSVSGPSIINLQYKDYNANNNFSGFYETNNLFGGINTPLVGTKPIFENNVNELAKLKGCILEAAMPNQQFFTTDNWSPMTDWTNLE